MIEVLPDLLTPGLIIVFCGTAASEISAQARAYYANPSNAFWRMLHVTGLTPRLYAPTEFRDLLELKIGLTDLAKYAAGNDRSLQPNDFCVSRLSEKIRHFQPHLLAFTSKTAWRAWQGIPASAQVAYGWQSESLLETRFFVLPSPSAAARRYWDIAPWQQLAGEYRRRLRMV